MKFGHLIRKCTKHMGDWANFCVLLRKFELYGSGQFNPYFDLTNAFELLKKKQLRGSQIKKLAIKKSHFIDYLFFVSK